MRQELEAAAREARPLRRRVILEALRADASMVQEEFRVPGRSSPLSLLGHAWSHSRELKEELDMTVVMSLLRAKADPNRPPSSDLSDLSVPVGTLMLCDELEWAHASRRPLEDVFIASLTAAGADWANICSCRTLDSGIVGPSPWILALRAPWEQRAQELRTLLGLRAQVDWHYELHGATASGLGHQVLTGDAPACGLLLELGACPDSRVQTAGSAAKLLDVAINLQDKEAAASIVDVLLKHKAFPHIEVHIDTMPVPFPDAVKKLAASHASFQQVKKTHLDSDDEEQDQESSEEDNEDEQEEGEESEGGDLGEVTLHEDDRVVVRCAANLREDQQVFRVLQVSDATATVKALEGCERFECPLGDLIRLAPPIMDDSGYSSDADYAYWDLRRGKQPPNLEAVGRPMVIVSRRSAQAIEVPKGSHLLAKLPAVLEGSQYTLLLEFRLKPFHGVLALLHTAKELGMAELAIQASEGTEELPSRPILQFRTLGLLLAFSGRNTLGISHSIWQTQKCMCVYICVYICSGSYVSYRYNSVISQLTSSS